MLTALKRLPPPQLNICISLSATLNRIDKIFPNDANFAKNSMELAKNKNLLFGSVKLILLILKNVVNSV